MLIKQLVYIASTTGSTFQFIPINCKLPTGNMPLHQDFESFVQSIADADDSDDRPVFAINLDDIQNKVVQWNRTFPRVRPFYAMKCNFAPPVVRFIANSGVGFDCASIVSTQYCAIC